MLIINKLLPPPYKRDGKIGFRAFFLRCAAIFVALMALGLGKAWGQDYVFANTKADGSVYYLAHAKESVLDNDHRNFYGNNTFRPDMCLWNLSGSGETRYIQAKVKGQRLAASTSDSTLSLAKSGSGNQFRGATVDQSNHLYYSNTKNVIYYTPGEGKWKFDRHQMDSTWRYEVTINSSFSLTGINATISGDESILFIGSYSYSYDYSIENMTCTDYRFINSSLGIDEHHYWYGDEDHPVAPTNWGNNVSATWSLSSNPYASVNPSTGEITVTEIPSNIIILVLTCTFTDGNNYHSVSKEITLGSMYVLMDSDGRIVKRDGVSSTLQSSTSASFTPEGTLWTILPFNTYGGRRHCYKPNPELPNYYLSLGGWSNGTANYPILKQTATIGADEPCDGLPKGEIKLQDIYYIYWNTGETQWRVVKNSTPENRVKPYSVSYNEGTSRLLSALLNGDETISSLGTYSYSYEYTLEEQTYIDYLFNNVHHYWYNNENHNAAPTNWSDNVTATWSLSSNPYASVDPDTGELTVIGTPAGDLVITLTCTFEDDDDHSYSVNKNITLKGMYLLMDNDGRIVKHEGVSTTLFSSTTFTPEGTMWTTVPYINSGEPWQYYKAKSVDLDCYLSLGGWDSITSSFSYSILRQKDTPSYDEGCWGLSENKIRPRKLYYIYWHEDSTRWDVVKTNTEPAKFVKPYGVSYSEGNYQVLFGLLSGNSMVTSTGNYPITLTTETINETYGIYQYNSTTHYWYEHADHSSTPVSWGNNVTTTWSFNANGADATFDPSTGLTVNSMPATDTEVVITCTITEDAVPSHTITLTHNVLLTDATPLSNVLTIDDRENHSWSYYTGTDIEGYNERYLGTLYSPQPRDVKITYMGNGGAVSLNETEENFVYYKTLEQGKVEGEYPYALIPNPFSKRPKVGDDVQGFEGWEIVSGGHYIKGYVNGNVLPLDLGHKLANSLVLENLPDGIEENTMAHIVLKARWTNATVVYLDSNVADFTFNVSVGGNASGTYETNFLVIRRDNFNHDIIAELPVTVMQVEPDGSADYRVNLDQTSGNSTNFTGRLILANDQMTKMEFVKWAPANQIELGGKSFHLGRGVILAMNKNISGSTTNDYTLDQTIRIESGKFNNIYPLANGTLGIPINRLDIVMGCDYDRVKGDQNPNYHDNLEVGYSFMLCNGDIGAQELGEDKVHIVVKSGKHQTFRNPNSGEQSDMSFYISNPGYSYGTRDLLIEGGIMRHVAGGASDNSALVDKVYTTFRIKGGTFLGCVFGGAARVTNYGCSKIVITGGQFNSWVAGAANGTRSTNKEGVTNGRSYIYIGGDAHVGALTDEEDIRVNAAQGGNVFGAGCGNSTSETGGQIKYGSNVVIADNAYILRGVYGGGAYAQTPSIANVYILNGTIAAQNGYVYPAEGGGLEPVTVSGGVFGGAALKGGGTSNIVMVSGTVSANGIYGGSNESGTMTGNTMVTVKGNSNVDGSVFGGGLKGTVDGNTTVNLEGNALVTGSAFAAGKGDEGDFDAGEVRGNATLNLRENAWVKYCVYGGGEIANVGQTEEATVTLPSPIGEVTIQKPVEGTGITTVNLSGGTVGVERTLIEIGSDHNSCHVFGAGKGSPEPEFNMWTNVNETRVNITGGRIYGSVFGGSDVGHVLGNINVDINMDDPDAVIGTFGYSEIDGNIFGGGHGYASSELKDEDKSGTESVTAGGTQGNVNIHVQGEGTILGSVFGGGRIASTGIVLCENDDDPETPDAAGEPIPDDGAQTYGHVEILIEGNVKIGHDPVPGYLAGDIGGNVYGGAMGVDKDPTDPDDPTGRMAHVKQTKVTVRGNALVKGTVNGGGESGDVWKDTEVVIDENCTIGLPRTGDLSKLIYSGNVFGGSWGSDGLQYVDMGRVYGNTKVNVKNGRIYNNVYGGGEYASVGTWEGGNPIDGTGLATVIIEGGTIGPLDASGRNATVFGGGMGVENYLGSNYQEFGRVFSTDVRILGGTISGNVFGGGNQSLVTEHKRVNILGGTVDLDVYGGSNGIPSDEGGLELLTGLKTVNIYGGHVNNVYGCSRSTIDGEEPAGSSPVQILARDKKVTAFVNISGGTIDGRIHGAGHAGEVKGSVVVSIGADAINNSPFVSENVDKDYIREEGDDDTHVPAKLVISGSVFGGSDYYGSLSSPSWTDNDITGYSYIYIDGNGYNMNADTTGQTKYMLINGNIYGSGTHCESGARGRHIFVSNYGDRVATSGQVTSATRNLATIQRCGNLVIDHSNFLLTGEKPIDGSSEEYYSVFKIDTCMYLADASALGLGLRLEGGSTIAAQFANMDSIRRLQSAYLPTGSNIYSSKFAGKLGWSWIGLKDPEDDDAVEADTMIYIPSETELAKDQENVILFNGETRLYVRYHQGSVQKYGELQGFFRMLSPFKPKGLHSFAYARPKVLESPTNNIADGGFLSYNTTYNVYEAPGYSSYENYTNTHQYPYTNVIEVAKGDVTDYRMWVEAAAFQGQCWYVDGTRGWGRDIVGDGWGLFPDKPKLSVSGTGGVYDGTHPCGDDGSSSSTKISFDYTGSSIGEPDIIFVVGAIKDVHEITGINKKSGFELRLFRYPGGHLLSNSDEENEIYYYDEGGGNPGSPNEGLSDDDTHGPGPNIGAMLEVTGNKAITLNNVSMDGLYGHTVVDETYLKFRDHNIFVETAVTKPLVVTASGASLTLTGDYHENTTTHTIERKGTVLTRGYNNQDASSSWYYNANYSGSVAQGGAVYVHPNATKVEVEGRVEIENNYQKRTISSVDHPVVSNVYLPTFAKSLNISNVLDAQSHIGITNPICNDNDLYTYNTFSPVAVGMRSGSTEAEYNAIRDARAAWTNNNFRDDQHWFFKNDNKTTYYSTSIVHYPSDAFDKTKTLFFGWTWANVVRKAPTDFDYNAIDSKEDLAWLISLVNGYNGQVASALAGQDIKQTADFDLQKYVWVPIGVEKDGDKPFSGSYDGQGHLITNLKMDYIGEDDKMYSPLHNVGLFGFVKGGNINRTFLVSGHIEPAVAANIGGLAGWVEKNGSTPAVISNSEAAVEIICPTSEGENAAGGLVGYLVDGHLHSSMAMPDIKVNNNYPYVGGLVGHTGDPEGEAVSLENTSRSVKNSFSNAKFTVGATTTIGGLVGNNYGAADIQNCYVQLQTSSGLTSSNFATLVFDNSSGRTIQKCYAFENTSNTSFDLVKQGPVNGNCGHYTTTFISSDYFGYMYSDNTVTINGTTLPLFKRLNEWVPNDTYAKWARPGLAEINGDLPVLLLCNYGTDNDGHLVNTKIGSGDFRSLATYQGGTTNYNGVLQYGGPVRDGDTHDLNPMLARMTTSDNVYIYGDVTETVAFGTAQPANIAIHEDAAILHPGVLGYSAEEGATHYLNTYVGVTFDNPSRKALDYYGNELHRDWHMFSTPLHAAPLGVNYNNDASQHDPYHVNPNTGEPYTLPAYNFYAASVHDGYFPSNTPYNKYDYFCWYEPDWQWINFKRNGNDHWHYDYNDGHDHPHIDYKATPSANENQNETDLVVGKGYMMSIDEDTYLQSHGELNNGAVNVEVYYTSANNNSNVWGAGVLYVSHNLIGNPYHAYLDFTKTGLNSYYVYDAEYDGSKGLTKGGYLIYPIGGSKGGYYAPQYLHPHQGFFVKVDPTNTNFHQYPPTGDDIQYYTYTFNNTTEGLCKTRAEAGGAEFRDGQPTYPLVNLFAYDKDDRGDVVVVEFNRPENGGGLKAKALRNGNHQIYARFNGEDYGAFFAKQGTERVPVWFKTDEERAVYTLRWNTQNGDFTNLRLIDNILGVNYDMLTHDSYSFEASNYDYAARFYIVFSCTDVEEHEVETKDGNFAFFDGSQWVVNGSGQLELIDMTGRVLQSVRVAGDQNRISLNRYANGVYLLRLCGNKSVKVQKIVKTK